MWTKLDDGLGSHRKLLSAAKLLKRSDGYWRALGVLAAALLHANRYLTDGHVPEDAFELAGAPREVLDALVTVRFLSVDAERGGYQIHDFTDWNPTAAQVRERQERDRIRKRSRQGYRTEAVGTPDGGRVESERMDDGFHAEGDGSSSRAVPGPARPDLVHPLTPSPAKGRPTTRAERKAALRALGPSRGTWRDACQHQPPCQNPTTCELAQLRERQEAHPS